MAGNGWLITDAIIKAGDVGNKGWRDGIPLSGLYRLYNKNGELLYIGWSKSGLADRIREHVKGRGNNSEEFYKEIHTILVTDAEHLQEILSHIKKAKDIEKYMVRKLNPKHNVVYKKENLVHSGRHGFVYMKRP